MPATDDRLPVVMVHGFLGSGDTWTPQINRFIKSGYPRDHLFTLDWNTLGGKPNPDSLLQDLIDSALRKTGARKVHLMGHSAGGGLCLAFLKDSAHSAKVSRYVHIGSMNLNKPPGFKGGIPTLTLSSPDDRISGQIKSNEFAVNKYITGKDHLEIATCPESFREIYAFFNNGAIPVERIPEGNLIKHCSIGGKCLFLGDNFPMAYTPIRIFVINRKNGKRKSNKPLMKLITSEKGMWGPVSVPTGMNFEFEIETLSGKNISYFFEPFTKDNHNMYLRGLPEKGMVAGLLKNLPCTTDQTCLAIFSASQAMISGRDSLLIDDSLIDKGPILSAARTSIALFLFDNGDKVSSLQPVKNFGSGVFLSAIDMMIPASDGGHTNIRLKGRTLSLPHRPSSKNILIAVFD